VNSNKGPLKVKWSNVEQLAKFANLQSGFYFSSDKNYTSKLLNEKFANWNQYFWDQRFSQGIFNLNPNTQIIDIGAGVSVIDLLLYSYIPNSKFYLVDQEQTILDDLETQLPKNPYALDYPAYHMWETVLDAINTSEFDSSRFSFLSPNDAFPENVDVITSYFSWCLHYPKEVYWEKAVNSLKKGGMMVLDVRPIHGKDVIEEISEELKSVPVKHAFPIVNIDSYIPVEENISCYRCVWIKNI
jgi:hypothetical protein